LEAGVFPVGGHRQFGLGLAQKTSPRLSGLSGSPRSLIRACADRLCICHNKLVKFAVNYSPPAVRLSRQGQIRIDLFKCPAWRDLVQEIAGELPIYVHFPLRVGGGTGHLVDTEKNQFADLDFMEALRVQSQTPFLNVHLAVTAGDCPGLAFDALDAAACERVASQLLRDLEPAVERWGADRIVLENIYDHGGQYYYAAFVPEVIQRVIETSGCGLLLDVSHARLGARCLGLEARSYLQSLPLSRLKEIHYSMNDGWIVCKRLAC
jgi:hypothetical protein